MRISDWSSDVCSSDLRSAQPLVRRCPDGQSAARARRQADQYALYHAGGHPPPALRHLRNAARRSDERRVGKECVRTCSFRWSPFHFNKKTFFLTFLSLFLFYFSILFLFFFFFF